MNIVFRVDASLSIGTGHVMRCLTLAKVLTEVNGAKCHFICREHTGNLISKILNSGFLVTILPACAMVKDISVAADQATIDYELWLGVDWETDAKQTADAMNSISVDWLIVDHYALDARWEKKLRSLSRKLMVIDDLVNRAHDCDLILDQNLGREIDDYNQLVPKECTVLAGSKYALLRPEFALFRERSLKRRLVPQINHLLITMGGVDQFNTTGKVLDAIKDNMLFKDVRITVIMGSHAPWLDEVRLMSKTMLQHVEIKIEVENMAELMAESDLAIGAAGSTSWERCCLGLPSIIGIQATNQQYIANALELSGAAKIFEVSTSAKHISNLIAKVIRNKDSLHAMSVSASTITNGRGAESVAAELILKDQ
jgi:UDP-2,4-diacetamido-2,4,6-trideoxy-beta-L-altropyranose hydrolase